MQTSSATFSFPQVLKVLMISLVQSSFNAVVVFPPNKFSCLRE